MAYSEAQKRYYLKYAKEKLKRIPFDVQKDFYLTLQAAADVAGESINGYIKKALKMRMEAEAGYEINGDFCGRDKNGVFHCACGKCKQKREKVDNGKINVQAHETD